MTKEELKLYMHKSCENILKKLAENPDEMLNLSDLQEKYNNLLKEKGYEVGSCRYKTN